MSRRCLTFFGLRGCLLWGACSTNHAEPKSACVWLAQYTCCKDCVVFRLDGAGRRRVFVVCSNDMAWCVEHIAAHRLRHVQFLSTHDPAVDLAVLATCQHSIITVGTFGWWAAWLSNGTTVYYKDWPRRGSPLAWHVSHADYFPPHWIPLWLIQITAISVPVCGCVIRIKL